MKTTLDLRPLTPEQRLSAINEAVAQYVAGWTYVTFPDGTCPHVKHWKIDPETPISIYSRKADFSRSADAVLPLLEKRGSCEAQQILQTRNGIAVESLPLWWQVKMFRGLDRDNDDQPIYDEASAPTFPLAACLALLSAHGVEVLQ